jgi:hypothetical protein
MRLIIRRHRPWRRAAIAAIAVLACGLLTWSMLDFGRWQYVLGLKDMLRARGDGREIELQNQDLVTQMDRANRALQVEEQSRRGLQDEITRLHGELAELQQEVEFYRNVIPGGEAQDGPRIEGFHVTPQDAPGSYRYRLVLMHVGGNSKPIEGSVALQVEGKLNGVARTLNLAELSEVGTKAPEYKFKYFQRFEGVIQLPAGFAAEQVHLVLRDKSSRKDSSRKSFQWAELVG